MNQEQLQRLLREYFDDTISETDCIVLLDYLKSTNPDTVADIIDEEMLALHEGPEFSGFTKRNVFQRIQSDPRYSTELALPVEPKIIKLHRRRWLNVAVVVLIGSIGLSLYYTNKQNNAPIPVTAKARPAKPIMPGGNKATLTLSDGSVIVLDNAQNGSIVNNGKTDVVKSKKGLLVYHALAANGAINADDNVPVYNTLTTPKGGEYQVVLPDGTKVWLNSASSIKYPTAFTGNERRVDLTGEAYFEVAKNKDKPFYVSIHNVEIRVLGTHFNIAAYSDDNDITTTLLEGSVQVKSKSNLSVIRPGYQAIVNNNTDFIKVKEANMEKVMAWKNGYFKFDDEDISDIMKKVSRWYDVDVEYRGNFNNMKFGGSHYRYKSINELLVHLEQIGKIHFKVAGRRIIVME
jgi:transmembrane sensor